MEDVTEIFKERLKELRKREGISQTELGNKIGVSRGAISYYENGDRLPDLNVLYSIADHFKVSSDYLIGLTKNETNDITTKEICKKTGLSDKAISNIEKLHQYDIKTRNKNSYLKGINYILSEYMNIDSQTGSDFPNIDYSASSCYQGSTFCGNINYTFYGKGIKFLNQLNQILFSSYIDFNPYVPCGHNSDNEFLVATKESRPEIPNSFSVFDSDGSSHIFSLEIITKAILMDLNDTLLEMRKEIEHIPTNNITIKFDEKADYYGKLDMQRSKEVIE